MDYERLIQIVRNLEGARVLLVGDFMLDRYIYGNIERISPEAPVVVVNVSHRQEQPGGAGSVAADLAVLEAAAECIGVTGSDPGGDRLRDLLTSTGYVSVDGLLQVTDRPTTLKERVIGIAQHRHQQQLMRIDDERKACIDTRTRGRLKQLFEQKLASCHVVCLQDYNKGVLTDGFCEELIDSASRAGKKVIVDPAPIEDYRRYKGAWMLKPNRRELGRAAGMAADSEEELFESAGKLAHELSIEYIVATLDREGACLFDQSNSTGKIIPTRPRSVYDVTGAGDMVMATLAALIGGSVFHDPRPTLEETVQLANVAGGLEVERFGCVGISRDEILTDLARQRRDGAGKLRTLESLLLDLSWHRQHGDRIVFTNGCFDILHAGHLNLLNFAKQQGDVLVVAINSDRSVRELKGDKRPILKEQERARMLSALEAVDFVVIFDGNTPARVIERITPDILIKGADWKGKVVGQDWVEQHGGEVRLMPLTDGRSTTAIIEEVLTRYQNIAEAEGDRS